MSLLLSSATVNSELTDISGISCGAAHACALISGNSVRCWGSNSSGQLGDGSYSARYIPVGVSNLLTGVVSLSAHGSHSCAVTTEGKALCWGKNDYGQLGDNSTTNRNIAVDVVGLSSGIIKVSAGYEFSCAITDLGGVKCWGRNAYGQLGNGTTISSLTPVEVVGISSGVQSISSGYWHACAVTTGGGAKCWGTNSYGELGDGTSTQRTQPVDVLGLTSGVTSVAAGEWLSCAVTTGGGVKCWGRNDRGQVGDGTTSHRNTAVDVTGLSTGALGVTTSWRFACALLTSGGVKCWGSNDSGQLGNGGGSQQNTPVDVVGLSAGVSSISSGMAFVCATLSTGVAQCWGSNSGALGNGTNGSYYVPVDISSLSSGVSSVSLRRNQTCAVLTPGQLNCWGYNYYGQIGDGSTGTSFAPTPVSGLASGTSVVSVGYDHTCAVTTTGEAKCWGLNLYGALGDGTTSTRLTPVTVSGVTSGTSSIVAGMYHTCALTTSSGVKCWGYNTYGQIGDGSTAHRNTPVDVSGLSDGVVAISAGYYHTCAVTTGNAVKCWGRNNFGQLGNGTTAQSVLPIIATNLSSGVAKVAAGVNHTCILTTGGGVKCWGQNTNRQIGDGSITQRNTEVDVINTTAGYTDLAAGEYSSCAVHSSGSLKCWGSNSFGLLGTGSRATESLPVEVSGLTSGVVSVGIGSYHACVAMTQGTLRCWGSSQNGQLGLGPPTPQMVIRGMSLHGSVNVSGTPMQGVALSVTNMGATFPNTTTTSDSDGSYSFSLVEGIPYRITPILSGYSFTPSNTTGVISSDVTANFIAIADTHQIFGTLIDGGGNLMVGVTVDGGILGTAITDSSGRYEFNGVTNGSSYSIAPVHSLYQFYPSSYNGTVVGTTEHNFTASYNNSSVTTSSIAQSTTVATSTTYPASANTTTVTTTIVAPEEPASPEVGGTTSVTVTTSSSNTTSIFDLGKIDSDGDGVTDTEEVSSGTNPNDPGSKAPRLGASLCSEWNGYLSGTHGNAMYNIMEHINLTTKKVRLITKLRNIRGKLKDTYQFLLRGNEQFDILVHNMQGREINSYGQICTTYERVPEGSIDGRMVYYKFGTEGEIQFAFALPFEVPLRGTSAALYNTIQPSLYPHDNANLVANWIQLSNLSNKRLEGMLYFHALDGKNTGSYRVNLREGSRQDYSGHAWGSLAGVVRFVPKDSNVDYNLQGIRYFYDNPGTSDSLTSAYPFEAKVGSGERLIGPVDTTLSTTIESNAGSDTVEQSDQISTSAVLEVANTINKKVSVTVKLYDKSGKTMLYAKTHKLGRYASVHIPLDSLLKQSIGLVMVKGSHAGSITASVVHYSRTASGMMKNILALPLREPVGKTFRSSYNTYLKQGCKLYLTNYSLKQESILLSLDRNSNTNPTQRISLAVPAKGAISYDVCGMVPADTYGVITVEATNTKRITGYVVRTGAHNRYRMATLLR